MNSVQCIMHCVRTFILLKNCHIWLGSCMEKKALTISNWVYFYCLSDNIVRIMYCTYFLFLVSYSLPLPLHSPSLKQYFITAYRNPGHFHKKKKKSESYSVILKLGYKLLCKSLLITEYSGHVPLKSWSFFRRLTGTPRLRPLSPTLPCASWAFLSWTSHISLALFSKMGRAEYFLWLFLPLEAKCFNAKPASSVSHATAPTRTQNFWCCPGILSAQQPFIFHPYPMSLFTWDFSWVSQAPTAL